MSSKKEKLILKNYSDEFLSVLVYDNYFSSIIENYRDVKSVLIDASDVGIISPSFMTRLLGRITEKGVKDIHLVNASPKFKSTFRFALFSIDQKNSQLAS